MTDERPEIIIVEPEPDTVEVLLTNTEIITVNDSIPGPRGPQGPTGAAGNTGGVRLDQVNQIYTQNVASDTWTVTHSLPYVPSVTVVDSAGTAYEGEIRYVSSTQIQIKFAVPFSGTVYLS